MRIFFYLLVLQLVVSVVVAAVLTTVASVVVGVRGVGRQAAFWRAAANGMSAAAARL